MKTFISYFRIEGRVRASLKTGKGEVGIACQVSVGKNFIFQSLTAIIC